ncbi:MAG: glycoside hydrolase family 2 protein, partial [Lachnobacterium sp.]|nr:glycoside hydrolase family 2 protein [Lachnobacterium sp.]
DMILQYRNHPSIFLWGVRINESQDDDEFYRKTNEVARSLDPTRATAGVRCFKNSHLLEDVYTYNDFVHSGNNIGCEKKAKVTSDFTKAYIVSEYNGHMYPTKVFDSEEHQVSHMLRHAKVLNDIHLQEDIAGSFGWCMFDYNTHKDFGSGDRICYHGVMDMFRNPKMASLIYACQNNERVILDISSSMDIGEHPGCNRGKTYILSNADSVRMYKNGEFIKEYNCKLDSAYKGLKYGPILIDDFIGDRIEKNEPAFSKKKAKDLKYALNYIAVNGYGKISPKLLWIELKSLTLYKIKPSDAIGLFNKYIGDWGQTSTVYKFEAIKDGKVAKTITKAPMTKVVIKANVSNYELIEKNSYDVAEVRLVATDENGNRLSFFNEGVVFETKGPIDLIGPSITAFRGGYVGVYVKSKAETGVAKLICTSSLGNKIEINFTVKSKNIFKI